MKNVQVKNLVLAAFIGSLFSLELCGMMRRMAAPVIAGLKARQCASKDPEVAAQSAKDENSTDARFARMEEYLKKMENHAQENVKFQNRIAISAEWANCWHYLSVLWLGLISMKLSGHEASWQIRK
ncbi:hypothetical protein A3J41_02915 [candidate division TM6 bacterium RIFCSPHIGHO2_12_FULL_38_8]|nr:MAG: hypothetical protein A3J41_02915 [candidate division TM6 bacterium RIFCSPHIGHO2_12_FULL_38_8]